MSTTDKWTNEYNDKEFAVKLENFASEFEQTRFGKINENTITDTETRKITRQIEYCKYVLQRLDNHKNELKPLLAEAYEKYRAVLNETLEFWNSQEWFEMVKNELKLEDKANRDLEILERLVKLAFDCDKEKESFKDYNTTALKVEQLTRQIERFEFLFNLLVKKKEKDNLFLVEEFGKYEPVIIEVLDYWKAELIKLQSGNVPQERTTKPPTKEKTLSELIQDQSTVEPSKTQNDTKHQPKLSINQIALKYFYEGLQITRENGKGIAEQYGHTSGEKLFQRFTFYSSTANRKAKPDNYSPRKLKNKIKLIESVIELLPFDKQARAIDEALILNKIYEAEYQ